MMEKLLGLALVLALVSTAYGQDVEVKVNGEPWDGGDVYPSDIITMNLLEPGMLKPFSATPLFGVGVDHGDLLALRIVEPPGICCRFWVDTNGGFSVRGSATYIFVQAPDGIALGFDFRVPDYLRPSDWINIEWEGNYGGLVPDHIALHVIPEPATIVLLGLGTLLLRRKF